MAQHKHQAERPDEEEMKNINGGMSMASTPHQDIAGSGYQEGDDQWRFGDVFQDGNTGMSGDSNTGMSSNLEMGGDAGNIR